MKTQTDSAAGTLAQERRFNLGGKIELREATKPGTIATVTGLAVPYNVRSQLLYGMFYEEILPGTFGRSFAEARVRGLYEHLGFATLGKVGSGTLRVMESAEGIVPELDLPDTSWGRDARTLIERGDISGWSFGFGEGKWDWFDLDEAIRLGRLKQATLYEFTLTADPAYTQTTAALRSLRQARPGLVLPGEEPAAKAARPAGLTATELARMRLRVIELEL